MRDLEFKFQPSKQFLCVLTIVFLSSVAITLSLPVMALYKWMLFLILLGYAAWILQRYVLLQTKNSITSIRNLQDGRWLLHTKSECYEAILLGDSTITRWVSVLRFRQPAHRLVKSCIVFRDTLELASSYRCLTVLIKLV